MALITFLPCFLPVCFVPQFSLNLLVGFVGVQHYPQWRKKESGAVKPSGCTYLHRNRWDAPKSFEEAGWCYCKAVFYHLWKVMAVRAVPGELKLLMSCTLKKSEKRTWGSTGLAVLNSIPGKFMEQTHLETTSKTKKDKQLFGNSLHEFTMGNHAQPTRHCLWGDEKLCGQGRSSGYWILWFQKGLWHTLLKYPESPIWWDAGWISGW